MNFIVPTWVWKVLIACALLLGTLYMAFDKGRALERLRADAKVMELAKENQKRIDVEVERSRAAALDYSVQHQALRNRMEVLSDSLDDMRRSTPIVVPAPRKLGSPRPNVYQAPPGRGLSGGAAGESSGTATPQTPAEFPQPISELEADEADDAFALSPHIVLVAADAQANLDVDEDAPPRLSFGAVRLWNSALVGVDLPAGACGIAGAPAGACAAASGSDFDAAWRNHERNAQSCAADRHQLQSLIDYLQQRAAFNRGAGTPLRTGP